MVHIHNGILLGHKKNKIMPPAATWMEQETLMLSEVSQKEKDKYHVISHIWNLIYGTMNLSSEKKIMDMENRLLVAKREGEGLGVRS